ncbi:hypothetical protein PENTCL1PPCAC_4628, partial [Pristionchus entomophagus]
SHITMIEPVRETNALIVITLGYDSLKKMEGAYFHADKRKEGDQNVDAFKLNTPNVCPITINRKDLLEKKALMNRENC